MKLLVYLGHPAHFYMFSRVVNILESRNHKVFLVCKDKDILEDLLRSHGVAYKKLVESRRGSGRFGLMLTVLRKDVSLARYALKVAPDLMIGTETSITHVGRLLRIPSFYFVEDDIDVIPWVARVAFPFATRIVSPNVCRLGKWEEKKLGYEGYQKLAYLHPNQFKPDRSKVERVLGRFDRYFLIRLSGLGAHHDEGIGGISGELARKVVQRLEEEGSVFISSENPLEKDFEPYRLNIDVKEIHHFLAFADLFISDSQSMSVEAAMLGTPSIRFSDFSGRISVLEELEQTYGLTHGVKTSEPNRLLNLIESMIGDPKLREEYLSRRNGMLAEKIDVTPFIVDLIENHITFSGKNK